MAEIMVTAAQLRERAETLRQLNESFNTQIELLQSSEKSVCSMWEGEAKQVFQTAFDQSKIKMDSFKQAIDQYANALLQIAQKYETAEQQNIQIARVN